MKLRRLEITDNVSTVFLLPGLDGTGDLFGPLVAALDPDIRAHVVRYPTHESGDYAAHEALAQDIFVDTRR